MHSPHIILFLDLFFLLAILYFLSFPFVTYICYILFLYPSSPPRSGGQCLSSRDTSVHFVVCMYVFSFQTRAGGKIHHN